ncbi:MAG TPA: flagellar biosynthesis anti-sigma factor FlgM [Bryobacteraceae bacterium]|jgi:anti-sigma28 factor (negative regulator of flagellin synthesis)|nr:flagellar biosynthesis anti-sigma factor FlgM [Bryobacteraceae bacterium]
MKIQDSNVSNLTSTGVGKSAEVEGGARGNRAGAAGAATSDQVSLSDLSSAIRAAQSDSPERTAHLEKLSADFQTGRYKVDAQALSKAIVNDAIKGE